MRDVVERLREYAYMLGQAQGTIQMLLEPPSVHSRSFNSDVTTDDPNQEDQGVSLYKESLYAYLGSKYSDGSPAALKAELHGDRHNRTPAKQSATVLPFLTISPRAQSRPREAPMPQQELNHLFTSESRTPGLGLLTRSNYHDDPS